MMSPFGAIAHAVGPMNVSRASLRDAGLAERQQHLAVGAELEQLKATPFGRGIVGERTAVARPEVAVAVLAESVRLHEHAVAEAS